MREYPKTDNLFERDDDTKKLIVGQYRNSFVPQILDWILTEKVDGTNVRLMLWGGPSGFTAEFRGRSDNANLPISKGKTEADLLNEIWGQDDAAGLLCSRLVYALDQIEPGREDSLYAMCVYGELHGAGIQKGGHYGDRKMLRIFDVKTHRMQESTETDLDGQDRPVWNPSSGYWRSWAEVRAVADALGLKTVPQLRINGNPRWSVYDIVEYVDLGCYSRVASGYNGGNVPAEGVIARTDPYIFDSRGHRVMFKLKGKDLPAVQEIEQELSDAFAVPVF